MKKALKALTAALTAFYFIACVHLTTQDRSELAQYEVQQAACITAHPGNKVLIDQCRGSVKKYWSDKWDLRFDGGFGDAADGSSDGGGE